MTQKLKDRVAIITGAGTGIGKGIAIAYAKEGAHIVGAARRVEKLQEAAKEVESLGRKFLVVRCDVSKKEDCQNVVSETLKEFGKVDILVNNAAIFPVKRFLEITPEDWDEVLAVTLRGPALMSQAVLPHMVEQKKGNIIMVNGGVRSAPPPLSHVHYNVAKTGLLGLTRFLASEFGPAGIRVNGFLCGFTPETEQAAREHLDAWKPEWKAAVTSRLAIKRIASVEDYQGIAVFLASDDSDYITGQTIAVDAGLTMTL